MIEILSSNCTKGRNHRIDTITIHCTVGHMSAKNFGNYFAKASRKAAPNYVIGNDAEVCMCVREEDRSWCSSSSSNDNRAITIEVDSDASDPYSVSEKVYSRLIDLIVDICKRYGFEKLSFYGDNYNSYLEHAGKDDSEVCISFHKWFSAKVCPGKFLISKMDDICSQVNSILNGDSIEKIIVDLKQIAERLQKLQNKSQD